MFESVKLWKLSSALKSHDAQTVHSAVLELGRMKTARAIELLINTLKGPEGVARSAARELGNLRDVRAVQPLINLLPKREVNQAAATALVAMGKAAVDGLIEALSSDDPLVRVQAAEALGRIGDPGAVDKLVEVVQGDNEYAVRTAAVTALGHLKDGRAIWVLVATLKLRDESGSDRRAALEKLRDAATLAMRRIGDPLQERKNRTAPAGPVQEANQAAERDEGEHPRLMGALSAKSEADLIRVLKELVSASEEISWAKLESREPLLAPYFASYDQRQAIAELIGTELLGRGGKALLARVLGEELDNHATIRNWWQGLGG